MDENIEKNVQAYELYQSGLNDGREEGLEEGIQKGIEEGIQKGMEKGILKRTIELAKSLLLKKVDINIISETTGLSLDEINNLNI